MSKSNVVFKEASNRALDLLADRRGLPSEPELAGSLGVSRTTVRSVLRRMRERGLISWDGRDKTMLRAPEPQDYFADDETSSVADLIERSFMRRVLMQGVEAGDQISELDFAREIGVSTSSVREYLIGFSRFGMIEKRRNSQWVFKGFDRKFALELIEIREMFELRSAKAFVSLAPAHPAWVQLAAIEAEHRELLRDVDARFRDFSELDERFHRLIHAASDNRFVMNFYDVIALVFHYHYQWSKADQRDRNRVALGEHLDYIKALQTRHVEDAEFFCRRHLHSARETLLRSMARTGPATR